MFARLGEFVSRRWLLTIVTWAAVVVCLKIAAPPWDEVTKDGDLAFLPADRPSVVGERLQAAAFPETRARSQLAIVFAREDQPLTSQDFKVSDRFASRFHNYLAASLLARAIELESRQARKSALFDEAATHLDEAIRLNSSLPAALHNRAILHDHLERTDDAHAERAVAWKLQPDMRMTPNTPQPVTEFTLPLVDVWTRHQEVFGEKLVNRDRHAELVLLQIGNEFMATDNMQVLDFVHGEVVELRRQIAEEGITGLEVGISGSAAVGGDMLQSAAESIHNTELFTIGLVVSILLFVYRAPLLALVPLITIGVSLAASMNILALLAQFADAPANALLDFHLFKTTKIFIVVILFGAGTDFCLFLIARYREYLESGGSPFSALGQALGGVGEALTASALTTVAGLGMMFFAEFGKFRSSGPAISLCLLITLLACLTLAPALLRAFGGALFWPFSPKLHMRNSSEAQPAWRWLSRVIVRRPGLILVACVGLLAPWAWIGVLTADRVTFDLLSELAPSRPSSRGNALLKRYFPIGESGPIIVLAERREANFNGPDPRQRVLAQAAIYELTEKLSAIEGVVAVRSLAEPLGDRPRRISLGSSQGVRKLFLQQHRLTESLFLAQTPEHRGHVTRFELVPAQDPFSREAIETLLRVDRTLQEVSDRSVGFWSGAVFSYAGTTAGIRDLRDVTRSDQRRIQVLVVLSVFAVLVIVLRRPGICLYLILSVLFSYFVTIGATEYFFEWAYGDSFKGLDWKVPLFLFVILVAVGEDYNIYLVTRVLEEQAVHGPFGGLRRAITYTGGIITSCGLIMAGTFISMTTGTLRGIIELGFALALGIVLDTFVVRTMIVPAFLALLCRWRPQRQL